MAYAKYSGIGNKSIVSVTNAEMLSKYYLIRLSQMMFFLSFMWVTANGSHVKE